MVIKVVIHVILGAVLLISPVLAMGHEMRPALLQIKQTNNNQYQIQWKIPRLDNSVISIQPQFPDWFVVQQKNPAALSGTGALYFFSATSSQDIHGMTIKIIGLETTVVDVLVQVELLQGERFSFIVQPKRNWVSIPMKSSVLGTIKGYLLLGIEHILSGFDHLLFVLCLLLITNRTRKLFYTISAFTLAHSITLSASALGHISLPGPPVEAVIALSILFLATELLIDKTGRGSLTREKTWLVAFVFGLLHGLGFAGALAGVGLPQLYIPFALAFFNIGVELGQMVFIGVLLLLLNILPTRKYWPKALQNVPAYGIGSIAAFWFIERLVSFWN